MSKKFKAIVSPFAMISLSLFIIIGTIHMATDLSAELADLINGSISQGFRRLMASIGEIFPFSLFELLIACLPIILFFVIYRAVKVFPDSERRLRFVINLAAVILLIYSGHLLALGVGHNTTSISTKMELTEVEVTRDNLIETLTSLRDEVNSLADDVPRDENGVFTHGYTYARLSKEYSDAYIELAKLYDFPVGYYSTAKGVMVSEVMSYLGIGGIYTYVTGEANINTNYPDYVTTFTVAHEMSHQRGFMRENEANFMAYLLTSTSDDAGIRYSGALNMYSYFASALYKTDRDAYYEIVSGLSDLARTDIRASNAVTEKYGDTIFEEISDFINDFYLTSSGSGGIISYSRVVQLVLAYRYGSD